LKIELDENLPLTLAPHLRSLGHDADTVFDEGLAGRDDEQVWRAAQTEGRFLITQDLDFSDSRKFAPGTHHGLLLLRLRDPGRQALAAAIREIFASQDVAGWSSCFVVATERKIRIRRPQKN
jgi:predicted nuclease of predicted toxin-antitoxin system